MPRLIIKGRGTSERVVVLDKDVITLGKDDSEEGIRNDINLSDTTVSRRHARITKEEDDYFIEDLKSTNHTFVNGKEIKKAKLSHGDRITIGFNTIIFEAEGIKFVNPSDLIIKFQELDRNRTIDLNYLILHQISEKLVSATSLEEFLKSVISMIQLAIKPEKSLLLLLGDDGELHCRAVSGLDASYSRATVERVRHEKRSMIASLGTEPTETMKTMMYRGLQSIMCAPILKYDEVIGAIYVEDPKLGRFSGSDLILLTAIANHISWNIEKVILNEKIKKETMIRSNLERFLYPLATEKITKESMDSGKINLKPEKVYGTILFSDIKGFTAFYEKFDPSEIETLLNEYYSTIAEIIFKYEGTLVKYDGGAVTAIFGAPIPLTNHARQAVLAAVEIQEEQRRSKEKHNQRKRFDIKIGITTGEFITTFAGSPKRMEYMALGEAITIANRLGSLAEPGGIFVSEQTNEAVKADYITKFVGKIKTQTGTSGREEKKIGIYNVLSKVL